MSLNGLRNALLGSAALLGCALAAAPAEAAPRVATSLALPGTDVAAVRYSRRHGYRRQYRAPRYGRRAAPSQAGNARDPSRPVYQQNQGNTSGGPRY